MTTIKTYVLGFPRIGDMRELKKILEKYWRGDASFQEVQDVAKSIRKKNWNRQKKVGISSITSNDFSLYDQVLDTICMAGATPKRFGEQLNEETYFLMARGINKTSETQALEMTKWFDTNYHYLVPEFTKDQNFSLQDKKVLVEFLEAKDMGIQTVPALLGPITFLYMGKEKDESFSRLELLPKLLPVYEEIIRELKEAGADWVRIDEPALSFDLPEEWRGKFSEAYDSLFSSFGSVKILLANYFGAYGNNLSCVLDAPIDGIHFDLIRGQEDIPNILEHFPEGKVLSAGVVSGRNIWKNDYKNTLSLIRPLVEKVGIENMILSSSCSLQFVPISLSPETDLDPEVKDWLAFAEEKTCELQELSKIVGSENAEETLEYKKNQESLLQRSNSSRVCNAIVRQRLQSVTESDFSRTSSFDDRKKKQQDVYRLPKFPTTTIGSFPQTKDVRNARKNVRTGEWTEQEYESFLEKKTEDLIRFQEEIDIDVLVHGEYERNDMVQYFGELLEGFVFTKNAWVQSYGSRCLKPPIIFGDVFRPDPMTIRWSTFAQGCTRRPVKGMLTGPVTILQWSFVREDIPRKETAWQIALALLDEVQDLEKAGIGIIQIDEPALREGLPLRRKDWEEYLDWATKAFRLSSSNVKDETQIHTHMCYSEFNDIIQAIADLDADVISIENSRSDAELLKVFHEFNYKNDIGLGIWDIHSPRVPSDEEMVVLLERAIEVLGSGGIWVNPDCGLKTRDWPETEQSLLNMVKAAKRIRKNFSS
jgi:5-methyltetrahydropteroyltriglutamate--homocysteine methyltransferase